MLEIPIQHKAKDKNFEAYYRNTLNNYLIQFNPIWVLFNSKLKNEEQLLLPTKTLETVTQDSVNLLFSESQYRAIAEILSDSFKIKFHLKLELLKLKNKVGILKYTLFK